jgi:hypothetical protein
MWAASLLPRRMSMERKAERDRQILTAFEAGHSIEELSALHGLTCERVTKIVTAERNKRTVRPETYYRSIRNRSP